MPGADPCTGGDRSTPGSRCMNSRPSRRRAAATVNYRRAAPADLSTASPRRQGHHRCPGAIHPLRNAGLPGDRPPRGRPGHRPSPERGGDLPGQRRRRPRSPTTTPRSPGIPGIPNTRRADRAAAPAPPWRTGCARRPWALRREVRSSGRPPTTESSASRRPTAR